MFLDFRRPRVEFSNFDFCALLRAPKGPQNQRNRVGIRFKKLRKSPKKKVGAVFKGPQKCGSRSRRPPVLNRLYPLKERQIRRQTVYGRTPNSFPTSRSRTTNFQNFLFPCENLFLKFLELGGCPGKKTGAKYSLTSPLKTHLIEFKMVTPVFLSKKQKKKISVRKKKSLKPKCLQHLMKCEIALNT